MKGVVLALALALCGCSGLAAYQSHVSARAVTAGVSDAGKGWIGYRVEYR